MAVALVAERVHTQIAPSRAVDGAVWDFEIALRFGLH
jgi:hypothetical protein